MIKAAIINVTGYAGIELARLLHRHPNTELVEVTGRSAAGQKLGEAFPHLSDINLTIQEELSQTIDVVFSALPQTASAEALIPFIENGTKSIDISADFRLKSASEYKEWYGVAHPNPQLLEQSAYGLPEINHDEIKSATIVANPGCYPTAALLALAPATTAGIIHEEIIVDAKSGVSGAGRSLNLTTHFSEVNENVKAYGIDGHRHLPEIVQEVSLLDPALNPEITFLPHLIPMTRGILSSCYTNLSDSKITVDQNGRNELTTLYKDFYGDEPFVRVVDSPPQTKQTWGNNYCLVYPTIDLRTGRVIVLSCIDNLVKGAAGQAIQNMNVMAGFPETMGLENLAVFP